MTLLLTILSVVAGAGLLTALALGLLLILKPLESVRSQLEQVAMGVRAIETHLASLGPRSGKMADSLPQVAQSLVAAGEALSVSELSIRRFATRLRR